MFEAYKIGIKISLINNVSAGLASMAAGFTKTEAQAALLEKRIGSIQKQALKGGLFLGAGVGILSLFKGPLDEAKKFQIEAAKFSSLGFGEKTNQQAIKFATGMNTIGTSARENMAIVGDAMAVFKNLGEAQMVAPLMAKMKFANTVLFGAAGADDKKLMDMMKVAEFRGGTKSPQEFANQVNFAQKAIAGSRNRVDPSAMLLALKTGGVALSQRSNPAFYLGAEPLIQEFGGMRYGTGAMSIYQNLVQSRGTITAQQEMYRLGLLNKGMVQFNKLGQLKRALPGAFKGSGTLEKDGELALLEKVLLPAFAAHGITSDEGIMREFGMILSNRTGSSLMARIYQQRAKLHNQTDANAHAENLDQASGRAAKTLTGKEIDLHAKYHTLMKNLGDTVLPLVIRGLEKLIPLVASAAQFVKDNATAFKILGGALLFVGLGLGINGGGMLLAAAFRGLGLALAFSAVGGVSGIAALAMKLPLIATGLAALSGTVLMYAGALGAAGYAGWKVGGAINHGIDWLTQKATGGAEQNLGGAIFDWTHPAKKQPATQVHVTIDGEHVRHIITHNMPVQKTGWMSGVNPQHSPLSPGLNFAPGL